MGYTRHLVQPVKMDRYSCSMHLRTYGHGWRITLLRFLPVAEAFTMTAVMGAQLLDW